MQWNIIAEVQVAVQRNLAETRTATLQTSGDDIHEMICHSRKQSSSVASNWPGPIGTRASCSGVGFLTIAFAFIFICCLLAMHSGPAAITSSTAEPPPISVLSSGQWQGTLYPATNHRFNLITTSSKLPPLSSYVTASCWRQGSNGLHTPLANLGRCRIESKCCPQSAYTAEAHTFGILTPSKLFGTTTQILCGPKVSIHLDSSRGPTNATLSLPSGTSP